MITVGPVSGSDRAVIHYLLCSSIYPRKNAEKSLLAQAGVDVCGDRDFVEDAEKPKRRDMHRLRHGRHNDNLLTTHAACARTSSGHMHTPVPCVTSCVQDDRCLLAPPQVILQPNLQNKHSIDMPLACLKEWGSSRYKPSWHSMAQHGRARKPWGKIYKGTPELIQLKVRPRYNHQVYSL